MPLETIHLLLHVVNDITPLGLAGLLSAIIFLLVNKRGPMRRISDNHLAHISAALERIADSADRQESTLNNIRAEIAYVKGRVD